MNAGYDQPIGNPFPDRPPTDSPFTHDDILSFSEDLKFNVFYLEAPLSGLSNDLVDTGIINSLVEFNIFHAGIGFQSIDDNQPYEFLFDLDLKAGFNLTALVPQIIDINGNKNLKWNNECSIFLNDSIDRDYWAHSTYIATMTSKQLLEIQTWILNTWIPQNEIYVLYSGIRSIERNDIFDPVARPVNCYSFVYDTVNHMKDELKVCIKYPIVPNIGVPALVSDSIEPINFEENKDEIITFYEGIINIVNSPSITSIVEKNSTSDFNIDSINNDLFTPIQLYAEFYKNLDIVYSYGYLPNGSIGYWRITNPSVYVDYVQIDIKRSFRSIDINNKFVDDSYSDKCRSNQIVDKPKRKKYHTRIHKRFNNTNTTNTTYISFTIIFCAIIVIIIYMSTKRKY